MSLPYCNCASCRRAVAVLAESAPVRTPAANLALNRAWEDHRRRWREENPIVSRDEIGALEEEAQLV